MKLHLILFAFASLCLTSVAEESKKKDKDKDAPKEPVVTKHAVEIDGKNIRYQATVGKLQLENDSDGKASADIFYVSYTVEGEKADERPVMFAFNGGPGSSAVWLHLAALGPRIVPTSIDGTKPLAPPHRVIENPHSILDVADLVFIDPVSTGYSRAADKQGAGKFHGLDGDIASVSDFIRRWVSENKRWASPKYVLGESYGGIRATGVTNYLNQQFGMPVNGVVLLSSLLDYRTLSPSQGNFLAYEVFLPTYTALAIHHGKIEGDKDALLTEAKAFASGPYASAIRAGRELPEARRQEIAKKMASLIGIDIETILDSNLRVHPTRFRSSLLKDEGLSLGRFDGRVAWPAPKNSNPYPSQDPSYDVIYGPISSALLDYFTRDLDWQEAPAYRILSGKVRPWKWGRENSYANVSDRLQSALMSNPKLRVLIQRGRSDLATPGEGITYSINQLVELPDSLREQIQYADYDAGHMFYLNQPDLEKMRKDLVKFITTEGDDS